MIARRKFDTGAGASAAAADLPGALRGGDACGGAAFILFMNNQERSGILTAAPSARHRGCRGRDGDAGASGAGPGLAEAGQAKLKPANEFVLAQFSTFPVDKSVHILYIRQLSHAPVGKIGVLTKMTPTFY